MRLFLEKGVQNRIYFHRLGHGDSCAIFFSYTRKMLRRALGAAGSRKKEALDLFGDGGDSVLRRRLKTSRWGKGRYTLPLGNAGKCWAWHCPQWHNALVEDERVLSQRRGDWRGGGQGKTGTMAGPGKEALMLTARFCSTETDRLSRRIPLVLFLGAAPRSPVVPRDFPVAGSSVR